MQAEENERAGRGRQACWQRKPNVQAEEAERSGRGRRSCWRGEGKRSGSVGASALAEEDKCLVEEDKCACCGKRVRWLWKE